MNTKDLLLSVLLFLGCATFGQVGIIEGRVLDKETNETLPFALVEVNSSTLSAVTNMTGEYLVYIPADSAMNLTFSYIGFLDTTITVKVAEGETQSIDIKLAADVVQLDVAVINGPTQGQAKALNIQKNADNIRTVVSAEQIGRFPDQNSAEALQRVSGVNIERDQGEGRYVLVRGLAPQFTNININGEQIPSPEADVRFVALDVLSSSQLASMEISKTLTPDMDGDAIGGSVNLITKTATTAKPSIKGTFASGYNNLMGKFNGNGAIEYGQRFGEKRKLGFLVNANYYNNNLGSDNWESDGEGEELELRDYALYRSRMGLSSTIDYKLKPGSKIYARTIYSRFADREERRRYTFVPEDDEVERTMKDRLETQSILALNLGGKHMMEKFQLDYEFQYSYGEQNTPYDYESVFKGDIESSVDFSDTDYPVLSSANYLDNTQYEFDELEVGNTLAKDKNITAKFNIGIPYKINNAEGLVKFGAKMRMKEKSYEIEVNKYGELGGVPTLEAFEGDFLDDNFLGGKYALNKDVDMGTLITYFNDNPEQFELSVEDKSIDEALESYEAKEDVYAGYLMGKHKFKKMTLIAGARYEYTTVEYKSSDVVIDAAGDLQEIIPVEGITDYGMFLPQLNVIYKKNKNTNVRAAATYSYSRPNFGDIVPSQEANIEDGEATVGNPNLKPVSALNLDFLYEHYFGNVGVISGGIFAKSLQDFIYKRVYYGSQYPIEGTPVATGLDVTQVQNGESATLTGVELGFQRQLEFLPGKLKNLKLYANYTFTNSSSQIQSRNDGAGEGETETIKLPGQASHVGNASLAYNTKKFNVRVSLNFNGKYLSEIGGDSSEDIYIDNRAQIDLSASYFLKKRTTIFVEFLNLTNQPFEAYMGDTDTYIQREFYRSWSRLGVKFDLSK